MKFDKMTDETINHIATMIKMMGVLSPVPYQALVQTAAKAIKENAITDAQLRTLILNSVSSEYTNAVDSITEMELDGMTLAPELRATIINKAIEMDMDNFISELEDMMGGED